MEGGYKTGQTTLLVLGYFYSPFRIVRYGVSEEVTLFSFRVVYYGISKEACYFGRGERTTSG